MAMQFDIHSPANTVLEALNFSAELRLEGVDAKQRKAFVDEVRCICRCHCCPELTVANIHMHSRHALNKGTH